MIEEGTADDKPSTAHATPGIAAAPSFRTLPPRGLAAYAKPSEGATVDCAWHDVKEGAGRRSRAKSGSAASRRRAEGHPGRDRGA
jgi:hypothetical protein